MDESLDAGDLRRQAVHDERLLHVGLARAPLAHDHEPEQPAEGVDRVVRPVVVVGPDADRVGRALVRVGELLAGCDEPARPRELAEVRAVVLGVVADAVRMNRERLAEVVVAVAEVDDDRVPHLALECRAGHRSGADRVGVAVAVALVDERAERAPSTDRMVHPLVAAGRRDVPFRGARLDPVLALLSPGLRLWRLKGEPVDRVASRLRLGDPARERVGLSDLCRRLDGELVPGDAADQRGATEAEKAAAVETTWYVRGARHAGVTARGWPPLLRASDHCNPREARSERVRGSKISAMTTGAASPVRLRTLSAVESGPVAVRW